MFKIEVKTKDKSYEALIFDSYSENAVKECENWYRKNNLKAENMISAEVINLKSNRPLGIVRFTDDGVIFDSYYS